MPPELPTGEAGEPDGARGAGPAGLYAEDLAYVHHVGHAAFAEGAGPEILRMLEAAGLRAGRVVDLGCGSGVFARALLERGYDVLGIDASEAFLGLARETAPGAELVQASAYEVELPPCVAVTAMGEVLSYAPGGEAPDEGELAALFGRVFARLAPGGLLAFDVMARTDPPAPLGRSWRESRDWTILVDVAQGATPDGRPTLVRDITLFRAVDGVLRRSHERHVVVVWEPDEVLELLRAAGLRAEAAPAYGDFALLPGRMAFVGRKPPG